MCIYQNLLHPALKFHLLTNQVRHIAYTWIGTLYFTLKRWRRDESLFSAGDFPPQSLFSKSHLTNAIENFQGSRFPIPGGIKFSLLILKTILPPLETSTYPLLAFLSTCILEHLQYDIWRKYQVSSQEKQFRESSLFFKNFTNSVGKILRYQNKVSPFSLTVVMHTGTAAADEAEGGGKGKLVVREGANRSSSSSSSASAAAVAVAVVEGGGSTGDIVFNGLGKTGSFNCFEGKKV